MSYASTVLADNPVGFWKLAEPSGTTASDAAGNQDGTYTNVTGITLGQTGIPGAGGETACRFTASNSGYVNIPDKAAQHVGNTFTVEVWARFATVGVDYRFLIGTANSLDFCILHTGGTVANVLNARKTNPGGSLRETSGGVSVDGSFHHLVWTKTGSTNHVYLDGVDQTVFRGDATCSNAAGYKIGIYTDGTLVPMDGWMQYVALYPAVLSAAKVLTHYRLGANLAPSNTVAPVASGTATVGQSLSVTNGTWTDAGSPTFTYQWQRDVAGNTVYSNISSATASSYTLVDADDGCHVRCVVTDTDSTALAGTANSNALGLVVEPAPTNSVAPVASGSTTIGSVVSTTNGTWTHMAGLNPAFTYQWQRDNTGGGSYTNIGSATASSYTLVALDDLCNVRCTVTATNTGGSASANSNSILDTTSAFTAARDTQTPVIYAAHISQN